LLSYLNLPALVLVGFVHATRPPDVTFLDLEAFDPETIAVIIRVTRRISGC